MITLKEVVWNYAVPPENRVQIVIMQRQDGPFSKDPVGGLGHYYVSAEIYNSHYGDWEHVKGSTQGGFKHFDECTRAALEMSSNYIKSQ